MVLRWRGLFTVNDSPLASCRPCFSLECDRSSGKKGYAGKAARGVSSGNLPVLGEHFMHGGQNINTFRHATAVKCLRLLSVVNLNCSFSSGYSWCTSRRQKETLTLK